MRTIAWIDGSRVVFEGEVSDEDRRKFERMNPGMTIIWEPIEEPVRVSRKGVEYL